MKRRAPRPLASALSGVVEELEPATTLARVQRAWTGAVGDAIAREAEPVAERDGVVTISCGSSVWAQEIELLAHDLVGRLNAALGAVDGPPPVRSLKVSASRPRGSRRRAFT